MTTSIIIAVLSGMSLGLLIRNLLLEEELRLNQKSLFNTKLRLDFIKENEKAMAKLREEYRNK
tara:strand:- start:3077 stop:3265 length:189 start_codon:yes stop_codon:yes gene_type:complete